MNESFDVVIVGAGVIGAAVALELSGKGFKTLNVDTLPAAGYGPTSNSCSIVRAHYSTADGVALAHENFSYWENWGDYIGVEDERGLARFIQCGTVLLKGSRSNGQSESSGRSRHDDHWQKVLGHYRALAIAFEDWDTDELVRRVPYLNPASYWPPSRPDDDRFWSEPDVVLEGAIFTSASGYVNDPQLATHNLQVAAEARGGIFRFNEEVTGIRTQADRVAGVSLRSGDEIDAPIVVNVAGPWSFVLNRMAGVENDMKIKTRALRHEVHHVPAPAELDLEHHGFHISDGDQAIYFRPEVGNTFLVGSEDPECDPRVWIETPSEFHREITREQWEAQVYRLARRVPSVNITLARRGVVDLYDVSDDWIPIYDKSSLPGYYMAVGTSGNQFKNAAGVGHMMAELIDACENGRDHDTDPVSVQGRYTGVQLNCGFYSRNRAFNPDSSLSVNG
jgi:sarcosine oxidase subunit beta